METNLVDLAASEITEGIRNGLFKAEEIFEVFRERIREYDPVINAVVQFDEDMGARQARSADIMRENGDPLGPLHGVPVLVKDCFDVKGYPTTHGSPLLKDAVAAEDHLHVQRLRSAGALIMGKTNMPEFSFGNDTANRLWGRTRNPYRFIATAGYSGGGAAAALACRFAPLSDGLDLGGSTRGPASWCNVVGFRPTPDLIPIAPNNDPFDMLSVMAPMGRRVDDVRAMLSATRGPHLSSPFGQPCETDPFAGRLSGDLRNLSIAFCMEPAPFPVDAEIVSVLRPAADALAAAGAVVSEADPEIGFFADAHPVFRVLSAASQNKPFYERFGTQMPGPILELIEAASCISGETVQRAFARRAEAWQKLGRFSEKFDLFCWPTSSATAYVPGTPSDDRYDWRLLLVSPGLNLPSASVPVGVLSDGVPTGLQIIGLPGSDRKVLEAAEAIERAFGAWKRFAPEISQQTYTSHTFEGRTMK